MSWWLQFPASLRRVVLVRLIGSIGAGGVLYLTPLVFHREAFSASSVTEGVALAALAGTFGRFASGALLDRARPSSLPVLLAVAAAMAADLVLLNAHAVTTYGLGQLLSGLAMGLYWPAIELAVRLTAGAADSPRGYALARTADALGIAAGALTGAALASAGQIRGIYLVDLACLAFMALLLWRLPFPAAIRRASDWGATPVARGWGWLVPLLPILMVSLVATAVPALMQSALPLDLVRGSLRRAPMPEGQGALLVGAQLVLLLLLQWPLGRWLAERPVDRGLHLSLQAFAIGALLLAASGLSAQVGFALVLLAQLPVALGLAAFLPTATQAVVELSPPSHQGLAMALFSQCFAVSAFVAPLLAGRLLDAQKHGVGVWCALAAVTLVCLPLPALIQRRQQRKLVTLLSAPQGGETTGAADLPETLYRVGPPQD